MVLLQQIHAHAALLGDFLRRSERSVVTHHAVGGQQHWVERTADLINIESRVQEPGDQVRPFLPTTALEAVE